MGSSSSVLDSGNKYKSKPNFHEKFQNRSMNITLATGNSKTSAVNGIAEKLESPEHAEVNEIEALPVEQSPVPNSGSTEAQDTSAAIKQSKIFQTVVSTVPSDAAVLMHAWNIYVNTSAFENGYMSLEDLMMILDETFGYYGLKGETREFLVKNLAFTVIQEVHEENISWEYVEAMLRTVIQQLSKVSHSE